MVKTIRPNEIVTDVTYDALDHITKLVTSCAGCGEVLSTYEYTYNDQGYIISEKATESLAGYLYDDKHDGKHEDGKHDSEYPHGNKHYSKHDKDGTNAIRVVTTERTYEYDENWQLTKCTEKEENKGTTTYSYKYDSAGNRTAYEKVSKGETVEKYSYKYNDSNQLISKTEKTDWRPWKHVKTTYEYDEDGNLISESSGKKDTKTYEYTVENHLKAVTTSNEVLMAALYDGDGNRLFTLDYVEDGKDSQKGQVLIPESAKTENGDSPAEQLADLVPKKNQEEYYSITQYVNDINRENTEVLMELKTDGTANAAYTYGYSRNSRDTSDGASYYLYDGRGSVSGLTSADGVTTNSYQYDPYGNTIFGTPVSINYYGYNGESTNTNTGYQYLRARYYNPVNGNFTTEDTNTGTTENPLTRNRYGYVNNNPLNYEDPTGHSLWSKIKSAASKVVNTVKNVAKKVVNTVKSAVNWVVNAVTHPKQTIKKAVSTVQNTYRNVKRAASSAGSNFVKSVSSGFQKAGRTFSSFKEYVSVRTSEIKATIKRELCTTANRVKEELGKVDWGKVAVGGLVIAGLGVATILTGGAAAGVAGAIASSALSGAVVGAGSGAVIGGISSVANGGSFAEGASDGFMWGAIGGAVTGGTTGALSSTATSTTSNALNNPLVKNTIENAVDTTVGTMDDLAHGREVSLGSIAIDFSVGMVSTGIETRKISNSENLISTSQKAKTSKNPNGYSVGDVDEYKYLSPGINRAEGNHNIASENRVQAHHVIQDKWAQTNVEGYNRKDATAILLETGTGKSHTQITNLQRARRVEQGYDTSIKDEFNASYREMVESGVDEKTAQKAIKDSYKYFDSIGAFD